MFYAVQLAERSDAALILAYCERLGDAARFRVTFPAQLAMSPAVDKATRLQENAKALTPRSNRSFVPGSTNGIFTRLRG